MTSWRSLSRALPWLVAPALFVGACGQTDHGPTTDAVAGQPSDDDSQGGSMTLLPMPTAGTATGRGGSMPISEGGTGGTLMVMIPGISETPKTVKCGSESCQSVKTLAPNIYVDPCCVDDGCGVNTQFLAGLGVQFADECQATGQVGERDADCPTSAPQVLPIMGMSFPVPGFVGCCRETGTCGVIVDQITVSGFPFASPQLGCVDSAPFFANKPGVSCGEAVGGAGGTSAGGAPATGEAGAPVSAGGAGGNP